MIQTKFAVSHAKYLDSTDVDGYPTGDQYADPVTREIYGWYPSSGRSGSSAAISQSNADYERRIVASRVMLVPDATAYSPRDLIVLPGSGSVESRTFFVTADVRDYNTGPFDYRPGGEIVIEKVTG